MPPAIPQSVAFFEHSAPASAPGATPRDALRPAALLVALSLAAVACILYATPYGAGVSPDSTVYVDAARHLSRGQGLSTAGPIAGFQGFRVPTPLAHYPPVYPALLAAPGLLGMDPWTAARWLNALLFGLNVFLVGTLIRWYTGSRAASLVGCCLFAATPAVFLAHVMAWSEPLFLFLTLLGLAGLTACAEAPGRRSLALCTGAVALACLTRYVGVVLIPVAVLTMLLARTLEVRRRVHAACGLGLSAGLPLGLWLLRNRLAAGSASQRSLVFHPVTGEHLRRGFDTVAGWLWLPDSWPVAPRALLVVAAGALFVWLTLWSRPTEDRRPAPALPMLPAVLGIFALLYAATLIASITFLDFLTPLDGRMLLPAFSVLLVAAVCKLSVAAAPGATSRRAILVRAVATVALTAWLVRGGAYVQSVRAEGRGYAAAEWRRSPLVARCRALPEGAILFSNGYDLLRFASGRNVWPLPARVDPVTWKENRRLGEDLSTMARMMRAHEGVLVYFPGISRRYLPSEAELKAGMALELVASETDGRLYRVAGRPPAEPGPPPARPAARR